MDHLVRRCRAWIQAKAATRRYGRCLHILERRLCSGCLLNAALRASEPPAEPGFRSLEAKLKGYIQEQVDILPQYAQLPVQRNSSVWDCRIVAIAFKYMTCLVATVDVEGFRLHLQEIAELSPLSFAELTLALPALKLAILVIKCQQILCLSDGDTEPDLRSVRYWVLVLESVDSCDSEMFARHLISYEQLLEADPAGIFMRVDAATKRLYREGVEKLASECGSEADEVADKALELSRAKMSADRDTSNSLQWHIGYYLLDDGKPTLRAQLTKDKVGTMKSKSSVNITSYCVLMLILVALLSAIFATVSVLFHLPSWVSILYLLLGVILCYEAADEALRSVLSAFVPTRILPSLEYRFGIPSESKTVLAVPSLLINEYQVRKLFAALEAHYSSLRNSHVSFAILTDYVDSDVQKPSDKELQLLHLARQLTQQLNKNHSNTGTSFCLLHRDRSFSRVQGRWIGPERKRGKLMLLNQLILTGRSEFDCVEGDICSLRGAVFVALVDDDNQLSVAAVQIMAGILSHPLNFPRIRRETNQLERGYAALHPCMAISRSSAARWGFMKALLPGVVDPESTGPDVKYLNFDLFADCGFFGIGLYHVGALQSLAGENLPRERTISPEILEGGFLRTGWARFVCFVQPFPSSLELYYERLHRWTRGDWQNLAILLKGEVSGLSSFAKYTVLSRIRSSLSPLARSFVLAILVCCSVGKVAMLRLLGYILVSGLPEFSGLIVTWSSFVAAGQMRFRWTTMRKLFVGALVRQVLIAAASLHEAFMMLDAILRTAVRVVRGTKLLEWRSAGALELQKRHFSLIDSYAVASVIASLLLLLSAFRTGKPGTAGIIVVSAWIANMLLYFGTSTPVPLDSSKN